MLNNLSSSSTITRSHYLYYKGRYFNICNNISIASPLLIESIKLNPEIIECWNTLGDVYYNKGEILASKYCFESALDYDRYNKLSYIYLSKILRKPTGKNEMEIMENCIQSLIMAKQALKYGKKNPSSSSSNKNALKDGELWFNLGNAYLMAFINCINGFKLESSIKIEKEEKKENTKDTKSKKKSKKNDNNNNNKQNDNDNDGLKEKEIIKSLLDGLNDNFFNEEYEQISIKNQLRKEIELELNDELNNLLNHIYIKKCLSSYKCAITKCTINKHLHHPDLYCNRSHIYIYQENYEAALLDLKLSIKYSDTTNSNEVCQAKIMTDALLPKLCKISKQISNRGGHKMIKKINAMSQQIKNYSKQSAAYFTTKLHYDLVTFNKLNVGFNGGSVIVIKVLALMQPSNELPLHFIVIDSDGAMFVLSFYLKGHALNYMHKINNLSNKIDSSTLIVVANPVLRHIKFTHGSKNIDFYTICFQKPEDVCIGGKLFFNK